MNENIDLRVANYLTIINNGELRNAIDSNTLNNLRHAVSLYAAVTSTKMIEDIEQRRYENNDSYESSSSYFR